MAPIFHYVADITPASTASTTLRFFRVLTDVSVRPSLHSLTLDGKRRPVGRGRARTSAPHVQAPMAMVKPQPRSDDRRYRSVEQSPVPQSLPVVHSAVHRWRLVRWRPLHQGRRFGFTDGVRER